jgi:GNAT superfamily N-acetyltransferase
MRTAMQSRPAPFPPERPQRLRTPLSFLAHGLSLRSLRDDDLPWLRDLYASTREEEMAQLPWPDAHKRAFLDQQFTLQHRHYLLHYPGSDFLSIEREGTGPIGRYYLQRKAPAHLVIDICLFPDQRGDGIGSALIRHSQAEAAALGRGMRLSVLRGNHTARRLYERLGFTVGQDDGGTHLAMTWSK